jgi:hypothetical protein
MDIKSLEEGHRYLKIQILPLREHNISLLQHQELNAVKCNNFSFFTTVTCSISSLSQRAESFDIKLGDRQMKVEIIVLSRIKPHLLF